MLTFQPYDWSKPPKESAGQARYLGDPAMSVDGIVKPDACGLDDDAFDQLKLRMRAAAPTDFESWLAALDTAARDLGGDATSETARLRALAV